MSDELVDLEYESQKLSEDRYERQKRISWWDQELLKNSNILVVGAGTLGNEVCKNLALLGVGVTFHIEVGHFYRKRKHM